MTRFQRSAALLAKIQLSLAIGAYDHVRDLLDGTVPVAGVELTVLRLPVEEMFYRFLMHAEFDVSEASLGKIAAVCAHSGTPTRLPARSSGRAMSPPLRM